MSYMLNPNYVRSKSVSINGNHGCNNEDSKEKETKDSLNYNLSSNHHTHPIKIKEKDLNIKYDDFSCLLKIDANSKKEKGLNNTNKHKDHSQSFEYEIYKQKENIYFQDKTRMLELLLNEKNQEILTLKSKLQKFKLNYKLAYKILDSPLKYGGSTRKSNKIIKDACHSPSQASSFVYDSAKASSRKENINFF